MKYTKTGFPLSFLLRTFAGAQCLSWNACGEQYRAFRNIRQKTLPFEGFELKAQYNPARMKSTSAQVDQKSIAQRQCFLCRENLPPEQHAVLFQAGFFLLVNPFPIVSPHYTIVFTTHVSQQLLPHFDFLLQAAFDAAGLFAFFYNGPRVGASAPDHLHVQAASVDALPMLADFANYRVRVSFLISKQEACELYGFDDGVRRGFIVRGSSKNSLEQETVRVLNGLAEYESKNSEPDFNAAAFRDRGSDAVNVIIFPRRRHRPESFFKEGSEQFLWSPASLDLCGIQVLPRECDFERAEPALFSELYSEVLLEPAHFRLIADRLRNV